MKIVCLLIEIIYNVKVFTAHINCITEMKQKINVGEMGLTFFSTNFLGYARIIFYFLCTKDNLFYFLYFCVHPLFFFGVGYLYTCIFLFKLPSKCHTTFLLFMEKVYSNHMHMMTKLSEIKLERFKVNVYAKYVDFPLF